MDIKSLIRDVPDFPKPGIVFKDITPLLQNPEGYQKTIDLFAEHYRKENIDIIVGIESRGFLFASVLSYILGKSFGIVRKKGKLPYQTASYTYQLEYGEDTVELHQDAIHAGQRVLIIDDLLATGGTVAATAQLVENMGGKIMGMGFVIELSFLKGRQRLNDYPIFSLIQYE